MAGMEAVELAVEAELEELDELDEADPEAPWRGNLQSCQYH